MNSDVTPADQLLPEQRAAIASLLGRQPRGLEAVQVWASDGSPSVIRVASLVDDKPFPTLYWLVDKSINYKIDQLEAAGVIAQLQARVDQSDAIRVALAKDHGRYIQQRNEQMTDAIKDRLVALNYYDDLQQRGIGGIADFSRIRCLHTYYAAHLVQSNTIGQWLDLEYLG